MAQDNFVIDDDDRYSRFRLIAWWDQQKLAEARVLVVGAGALGNEVLKNLALLGVGTIYVVDFDHVEPSNLTRSVLFRSADRGRPKAEVAAAAIRDMNPDIKIKSFHANIITDIGLGLFRDVDVVIGCLDNREARLWVNRCCWRVKTPWIDAGIQEISGVVKVFVPPDSACYECAMTENDYRLINLRYSCPLLRQEDLLAGKVPTAPTISSMMAGLQTQEALKLIHCMPVDAGQAMIYNGITNQFYKTAFQFREDCLSHETYAEPVCLDLSVRIHTAEALFQAAAGHFAGDTNLRLRLIRDLVVAVECTVCGSRRRIMRARESVSMDAAKCPCGELAKPHLENAIEAGSELSAERLGDLGVPPYAIVRIEATETEQVFLLTGDKSEVMDA